MIVGLGFGLRLQAASDAEVLFEEGAGKRPQAGADRADRLDHDAGPHRAGEEGHYEGAARQAGRARTRTAG